MRGDQRPHPIAVGNWTGCRWADSQSSERTCPITSPSSAPQKAAWLINQHPKVSHSFISREIAAMEARGWEIDRISIRGMPKGEANSTLDAELARTHVVLAQGGARLVRDALSTALRAPGRFLTALRAAWRMGGRSERGRLVHLIYLCEAAHIAKRLQAAGTGHLHAHFGTNSATVARLVGLLSGIPWSFTVHGPEEFDSPRALSLGEKISEAAFTVAISHFGASQLRRWAPAHSHNRIAVVRCGIDFDAFDAAAGPDPGLPETPRLVCVGRLSEQKGHTLLLDAAAQVLSAIPEFQLVLVGDGELRAEIEARIAELGLGQAVTLTGWADGAAVQRHIRDARALVLGSFAEGLPVVIMEAFALNRPVISTWVAGIPELLDDSCGWRVAPGDTDALATAMIEAATAAPARLEALAKEGRARVLARHDIHVEAEKLDALITKGRG